MYEANIDYDTREDYSIECSWPFEITKEELALELEIWERVKAKLLEKAYAANADVVVFKATA